MAVKDVAMYKVQVKYQAYIDGKPVDQTIKGEIGDFEDRYLAEQALANAANSPDFRGGKIVEIPTSK
jgi:hypothetical protein